MTNPPEGPPAPTGSDRPPSPLQPPRPRRDHEVGAHNAPPNRTSPTGPPTSPPTSAPVEERPLRPSPIPDPPPDFDSSLSRPTPRQLADRPENQSWQDTPAPQKPRPRHAGNTQPHGHGLDGPAAATNDHHGPVPVNSQFAEPGRAIHAERNADDLRPVAPHLDPRIARLTEVAPPKRKWFGRGKHHLPEPPPNVPVDALTRAIETPRRISVVGLKGGVGKTTSAILLARTISRARPEPVLLLDGDTTYGSLLLRLGTPPIASAHDIASMGDPGTLDVLRGVIARTDDGVWVLPSGRDPAQSAAFSEQTYVSAVRALYRYFPVSITDCGTGIAGSLMRRVIEASHALVIATSASVDGVLAAHNALQWLISTGHAELANRAIVVIGNLPQQPVIDIAETRRGLEQICRAVVCVPTDPGVSTGGYIDFDQLQPTTRQAGHDLASLALECAFLGGR